MMFKKNLVACVKVGGKILRENSDRVTLPFGSEYSLLLKNLDSVRVQVKVSVDGKDATEGTWLVIEPNSSLELERFIRNGNLEKGNRFKFIERTNEIEETRGIKADDGLIRVEYKKEYVAPKTKYEDVYVRRHYYNQGWLGPYVYPYWYGDTVWCQSANTSGAVRGMSVQNVNTANVMRGVEPREHFKSELNDAGITVPGSESNQKFTTTSWFATESETEVLVLHLVGRKGSVPVANPVTVSDKPTCVTCHKVNKATSKFCSRCGTALEII
jgi:hypothetical protein